MLIAKQNGYTEPNQTKPAQPSGYGRVSVEDVLHAVGNAKRSGRNHRAYCPECNPDGCNHKNRALTIFDDGGLYCHRCESTAKQLIPLLFGSGANLRIDRPQRTKHDKKPTEKRLYKDRRQIESIYQYTNRAGKCLYQKVRFSSYTNNRPKYIIRHMGEDGRWYYGKPDGVDVLYNLPDVRCYRAKNVIILEGEKDVDRVNDELKKLGLYGAWVATCGANGSKWRPSYTNSLHFGTNFIILPDNDEPGRKYADIVSGELAKFGANTVRVIELPGLAEGGDVSDYLDMDGRSLTGILAWAKVEDPIDTPTPANTSTPKSPINRTAETCDCEHCQYRGGAAVTIWENETSVTRLSSGGTHHNCKRKLHDRAYRITMQILQERTYRADTVMHLRTMPQSDYQKMRKRNNARQRRKGIAWRCLSIPQTGGNTALITHDSEDAKPLPDDPDEIYDLVTALLVGSDPSKQIQAAGCAGDAWGIDYRGSKGNGKRKSKIAKLGEEAAGKCSQYMSKLSPAKIGRAIGKRAKRGKVRFKMYCLDSYQMLKDNGVDLIARKIKGAVSVFDVAEIESADSGSLSDSVTDFVQRESLLNPLYKNGNNFSPIDTSDDEIQRLIPLPLPDFGIVSV